MSPPPSTYRKHKARSKHHAFVTHITTRASYTTTKAVCFCKKKKKSTLRLSPSPLIPIMRSSVLLFCPDIPSPVVSLPSLITFCPPLPPPPPPPPIHYHSSVCSPLLHSLCLSLGIIDFPATLLPPLPTFCTNERDKSPQRAVGLHVPHTHHKQLFVAPPSLHLHPPNERQCKLTHTSPLHSPGDRASHSSVCKLEVDCETLWAIFGVI